MDVDPGDLSSIHAVRVVRRQLQTYIGSSPQGLERWHRRIPAEIAEEQTPRAVNLQAARQPMTRIDPTPCLIVR